MDAHKLRMSRWSQSRTLAKLHLTLKGYSRAAYRTCFYIPELKWQLDAGSQNYFQPQHIFITHLHADHIGEIPYTLCEYTENSERPQLYGPPNSKDYVQTFIRSFFEMSNVAASTAPPETYYRYCENQGDTSFMLDSPDGTKYRVDVMECDHSVPTVGYMFSSIRQKLKDQYRGLKGKEIGALRQKGVEITEEKISPMFSYVCDCSIETVARYETQLGTCPYVIVECTFLLDEELDNAHKTKHIHWQELEPYVSKYEETEWILIHFSLRYTDEEINAFFKEKQQKYSNLRVWTSATADS